MARIDVLMPQMGESIAEGTLSKWLKKLGDEVKRDEPLFEISTDKVDAEIPAPSAGVLAEIKVQEGQTVPVQTLVAVIETDKAAASTVPPVAAAQRAPAAPGGVGGAARDTTAKVDTARVRKLLSQRPVPYDRVVVQTAKPLTPEAKYLVRVRGATNLSGVSGDGQGVLVVPKPKPVPTDTSKARPKPP
jgi:2-oxoglutarate dehydrogenase E2 component (dihydrolipoamide succinyltransferase)